jgi:hypothetical protein
MKIIGFSQLRNELSNGNLKNWFQCMQFCEKIYIYDQNSDDGSKEYYKKFDNTVVIESPINNFENEITCKSQLLQKLLKENPDTDWIFWIDGDTILDGRLLQNNAEEVFNILAQAQKIEADSIVLGHYNLWRSDLYYRVDSDYDWFHKNGRHVFWRNNGKLKFLDNGGLHQPQFPRGIERSIRIDRDLIHRGFATDGQIMNRYNLYKSKGQSGPDLDRLIDESNLKVEKIKYDVLPDWYQVIDTMDPTNKRKLNN